MRAPAPENDLPVGLSQPAQRALAGANIHGLEQLSRCREVEVAELHGIGPQALILLRQALAQQGLSFAPEV